MEDAGGNEVARRRRAYLPSNPRKTECGANMLRNSLVVRAAPFALLRNRCLGSSLHPDVFQVFGEFQWQARALFHMSLNSALVTA